jgi:hypothetical protein
MPTCSTSRPHFIPKPLLVSTLAGLLVVVLAGCALQENSSREAPAPPPSETTGTDADQTPAPPQGGEVASSTEKAPVVEGGSAAAPIPQSSAASMATEKTPAPEGGASTKTQTTGARQAGNTTAPQKRATGVEGRPDTPVLRPKPSVASSSECYRTASGGGKRSGKAKKSAGRCEPQSLPFARCRSGINSCKLGNTGPMTWFICEKNRGNTGDVPRKGSILILGSNGRRGMPTGHVAYVEDVVPESAHTWKLILSHTNYDRRCSLETEIETRYDRRSGSIDFLTGAWKAWAKGLKVAGFILD